MSSYLKSSHRMPRFFWRLLCSTAFSFLTAHCRNTLAFLRNHLGSSLSPGIWLRASSLSAAAANISDLSFFMSAKWQLTPELSDHGQRQDGPAVRTNVPRCPWFAPVTLVRCHSVSRCGS